MGTRLFISYCRHDKEIVNSIVDKLALVGYDFWMDVKDIDPGDDIISKIAKGLKDTDVYMVFLSKASVASRYVNAEISFAVKRAIDDTQFSIIPILIERTQIPDELSNRDYINALTVSSDVIDQINRKLQKEVSNPIRELTLSSMEFTMSEETMDFDYDNYTENDIVDRISNKLLSDLRGRAYGILMNFVPIDDIEIGSEVPHFNNGIYYESIDLVLGDLIGRSCKKRVSLRVIVYKPDEKKVRLLIEQDSELMKFESITYGFSLPIQPPDTYESVLKRCLKKLLKDHVVPGHSPENGPKFKYSDDLYISLTVSGEQLKVTLSADYEILLMRRLKEFDVYQFVKELLS